MPVSPHALDTPMPDHGRSGATSTGSLRHGIQEGVNNMGNKRVVADSSRCIGCQTCMAACIEAHDIPGNIAAPRLRVTRTYEISAPVACHHCEDAPCAKACPTGALFFDPKNHRIGVNEDNCIGCKSCVMACPFGAVSVATTQVPVLMATCAWVRRPRASCSSATCAWTVPAVRRVPRRARPRASPW